MPRSFVKRKIVLLGDASVGKTSLIRRFVLDQFSDEYLMTIGVKVTKKDLRFEFGPRVVDLSLLIWDVLGQKGYKSLHESAFFEAKGVLLVHDLTRPETRESLENYWMDRVRAINGPIPGVIVGNKVDLVPSRTEAQEEVDAVARRFGTRGFLSSAKTGENVQEAFMTLGRAVLEASGIVDEAARASATKPAR